MSDGSANPSDFSPQAVAKAVLRETLQKPYVLYPTAVGVLGGLAALVLGPSLVFVAPAAVGLALGVGGWALDYTLRRDRHAAEYVRRLQEAMAGRAEETMKRLRAELEGVDDAEGLGRAALAQMQQLRGKYDAFEALLRRKLDPREMTFARYLGMTEQVFLGGLDNLRRISDTLKGLSAIDEKHIRKRLHALAADGVDSPAQDREIAALQERLSLRERQLDNVDKLLAENEAAMTQIDHVMAAIAGLDTSAGHASMTMEAAMSELRDLAARAHSYSGAPAPDAPGLEAPPPQDNVKKSALRGKKR
jgi:hypothetical protein